MKITDVRSKIIAVPFANWGKFEPVTMWYGTRYASIHPVFWIDTDEGITGISTIGYPDAELNQQIVMRKIKPSLIGQDPFNVEKIAAQAIKIIPMYPSAVAAVDIALWDIIGKACNKPLYKLWGGKIHDPVRVRYWMCTKSPEDMAVEAEKAVKERGWKAFKIKIGTDPETDLERVRLIREAVGNDVELGFDINGGYNLSTAIRILKKMAEYNPSHFEEPVPSAWPYDAGCLDNLADIRQELGVPIEIHSHGLNNKEYVMALIQKRAADILHTNSCFIPGVMEGKRICGIAEAGGLIVTGQSNCAELGPENAFNLHWIASTPAFKGTNDSSTHRLESPASDIITKPFKTTDGTLNVPEGPGLGVELDMEKVEQFHQYYIDGKYKDAPGISRSDPYLWN
ncbi:MAG: mandelate racemase/muconate lactonizing enzyme family protein [Deltaproteobacteria bacterium]|nr:mandelate racemase/muconate lactonizing enzyme family protein [Deltaproteobacteria bacterium]